MIADWQLPWFFGTGASTAMGDSGLRSASLDSTGGDPCPTSDSAEEAMFHRIGIGARMEEIEIRLSQCRDHYEVLRLHYGFPPVAHGITLAVIETDEYRALVRQREAKGLPPASPRDLVCRLPLAKQSVFAEAARKLVDAARTAYDATYCGKLTRVPRGY